MVHPVYGTVLTGYLPGSLRGGFTHRSYLQSVASKLYGNGLRLDVALLCTVNNTYWWLGLDASSTDLDDFLNKPRNWLQLSLGNVHLQCFEEDTKVWLRSRHSGKQIRNDPFKQWYILKPNKYNDPFKQRYILKPHKDINVSLSHCPNLISVAVYLTSFHQRDSKKESVTPSSHHRHGQDKTVLSCPCQRCKLNWRQDKTVFSSPQYIWDWTVANWKLGPDKTKLSSHRILRQDKTVLSPIQFTLLTWTKQDKTVLSCLCWRFQLGIRNTKQPTSAYNDSEPEWQRW